jgi:hypothetical protein
VELSNEIYLSIAEVSGVFIAFGAMMSTSRQYSITTTILLRMIVVIGLVVMVGALAPMGLAMFGLEGSNLWRASCGVFLALETTAFAVGIDKKLLEASKQHAKENRGFTLLQGVLEVCIYLPLLLGVFGFYESLWQAFFTVAILINLVQAALLLAKIVYIEAGRDIA